MVYLGNFKANTQQNSTVFQIHISGPGKMLNTNQSNFLQMEEWIGVEIEAQEEKESETR